ncbi:hypothetical protein quinque_012279 [Culex quinquefasciatus]
MGQFWSQITTIFQQPTFTEKVEEAKQVFNQYRALIKTFSQEWLKFFTKNRQDAIANVQKVIQDTNQEIKSFFTRKFSEFDGLCLPEDNECLKSVQNSLKEYSIKVEENTAACGEFVNRQLDQHGQLVEDEQKKLESGMLRIDGCFQKKEFLGGIMACVGSVAANFFHQTSQATQKFATAMGKASASVTNRLGRFRTCVVERKRLLAGGQNQIAEKATACLKAQKSSPSGAEASIKVDHNNEANFPATQAGMWTDGIILLGTLICAILLLLLGAVVEQVNGEGGLNKWDNSEIWKDLPKLPAKWGEQYDLKLERDCGVQDEFVPIITMPKEMVGDLFAKQQPLEEQSKGLLGKGRTWLKNFVRDCHTVATDADFRFFPGMHAAMANLVDEWDAQRPGDDNCVG